MAFSLIDISRELVSTMAVWPGSAPYRREVLRSFEAGDDFRESQISMNIHTGTHMDRPSHFVLDGSSMNDLDLSILVGACVVVDVGSCDVIDVDFVHGLNLEGVTRVLFKTRNSFSDSEKFDPEFVAFTAEAAKVLAEQVRLVGIDGPSVERFLDTNHQTHENFLDRCVVIIENLILKDVAPGHYGLIALPLRLEGAEGSPLRAVLFKGSIDESSN